MGNQGDKFSGQAFRQEHIVRLDVREDTIDRGKGDLVYGVQLRVAGLQDLEGDV